MGRSKAKRSVVAQYFIKGDDGACECTLCHVLVKTSGNTTNLRQHFQRKHPEVDLERRDDDEDEDGTDGGTPRLGNSLSGMQSTPAATSTIIKKSRPRPPKLKTEIDFQLNESLTNSFNRALETKVTTKEDDCDIFGRLLAAKIREYPRTEREEIMHEVMGLMLAKRRRYNHLFQQPPTSSYVVHTPDFAGSNQNSMNEMNHSYEPMVAVQDGNNQDFKGRIPIPQRNVVYEAYQSATED